MVGFMWADWDAQSVKLSHTEVYDYQRVLGRESSDAMVRDFVAINHCHSASQFEICEDAGITLWFDAGHRAGLAYLYSGREHTHRYQGNLPYGLSFYDPMWIVVKKLGKFIHSSEITLAKWPDFTGSPDHIHYYMEYKKLGLTVVYSSGVADPDAYIYALLVSK